MTDTFAASASDYTGVREVSADRLLQITDNTARTKIIGKYINVVRSQFNGFESDTTGAVPIGYTAVGASGTVSTTRAFAGAKALRINDTSGSVLTNLVKTVLPASTKNFEARVYPVAAPTGNTISLNSGGNDNTQSVFHLNIAADGSISWYNGSAWVALAGAGTVPSTPGTRSPSTPPARPWPPFT